MVIECTHVTKVYDTHSEAVVALDDVCVRFEPGRLTAVTGVSGSGKSTLLALVGCLDRPTAGSITLAGQRIDDVPRRRRRTLRRAVIGTLMSQPTDNLRTELSVDDNIALSSGRPRAPRDEAERLLELFAVADMHDRVVASLSSGEQQRVALACVMLGGRRVILADEPTGALDRSTAAQVARSLAAAADTGATVVVATHDPIVVAAAHSVVALAHGRRTA